MHSHSPNLLGLAVFSFSAGFLLSFIVDYNGLVLCSLRLLHICTLTMVAFVGPEKQQDSHSPRENCPVWLKGFCGFACMQVDLLQTD